MLPLGLKQKIMSDLRYDEGLRLKPYTCPNGKLTIGYGRNLDQKGITRDEAEYLLSQDVESVYLDLFVKLPFFNGLPEKIQAALINMAYNMGTTALFTFRRMLIALEIGRFDKAADAVLMSLYARQVPNRAKRIATLIREAQNDLDNSR